ncbi:MAG: hypothetical protein K2Q26_03870 [Bdellovibrionales bacterium]|nr:hypothetical protein [Bdellovibrionales bacterium]
MATKQHILLSCEKHSLGAQEKLIAGADELVALNPTVKALIIEKKKLELAVKTAPSPMAKAAAKLMLDLVRMQMVGIRTLQKAIIVSSESLAWQEIFRFKTDIHQIAKTAKDSWRSSSPAAPVATHTSARLQVQELTYLGEKSLPTYQRSPNYEIRQRVDLRMAWNTKHFLPPWLGKISKQLGVWVESCGAQPRQEGGVWYAVLSKDRLFSKF